MEKKYDHHESLIHLPIPSDAKEYLKGCTYIAVTICLVVDRTDVKLTDKLVKQTVANLVDDDGNIIGSGFEHNFKVHRADITSVEALNVGVDDDE